MTNNPDISSVYVKFKGYLMSCAADIVGYDQSEDIVHDVFEHLIKSNDLVIGDMKAYLARSVINRGRRVNSKISEQPTCDIPDRVDPDTIENKQAPKYLPDILQLVAYGYSNDEIATIMDISNQNVRVRIHRARRKLNK